MEPLFADSEELLTPDHFKNMSRKTNISTYQSVNDSPNIIDQLFSKAAAQQSMSSHQNFNSSTSAPININSHPSTNQHIASSPSSTINILHLLAQKESTTAPQLLSSPIKIPMNSNHDMRSVSPPSINGSQRPPLHANSSPLRGGSPPSSERWAGAAFFNSPAPSSLPIPSFGLTPQQHSLKSLDPSILTFSPKPVRKEDEQTAHFSTSAPNSSTLAHRPEALQREVSPPRANIQAQSQPTTPVGKKTRRARNPDKADNHPVQHSSNHSSVPTTSPKKPNKRHQRTPSWSSTSGSTNPQPIKILQRQNSNQSHQNNHREPISHSQSASELRNRSNTSPMRQPTQSDNGNFDQISNQIKSMLNICSA